MNSKLDNMANELREIQRTIEELTAQADTIKDAFKAAMIETGKEELTGNGWKATWKTVTSSRFDGKALKAADPATYEKFCKPSVSCRFVLV